MFDFMSNPIISRTLILSFILLFSGAVACTQQEVNTETAMEGEDSRPVSLTDSLASRAQASDARSSEERLKMNADALQALIDSGILDNALNVGDTAPDFTLTNATGQSVSLYKMLESGPVVLFWYRGGWCPYCNLTLQYMQRYLPKFQEHGANMMALTPELPDSTLSTNQKHNLEFEVLSDIDNVVGKQYGVVYKLTDDVANAYNSSFGLSSYNGNDSNELPLGATYIIGTDAVIRYAFIDPDYRRRAEPDSLLMVLDSLKPKL